VHGVQVLASGDDQDGDAVSGPTAFRVYGDDELGDDGYPLLWHKLPEPEFEALLNKADLVLPGGIKDVVRGLAGNRCVRCKHPFRVRAGMGQWSPCDQYCLHAGPARGDEWPGLERDDDSRWRPIRFSDRWPTAGEFACRMTVEAEYRILTVHHLNGDKADCRWWNLAALCQRCHLTIQGKVVMDRIWPHEHSEWFKPYVAGFYAWRYLGEDIDRAEAVARVDELLALEIRQLTLEDQSSSGAGQALGRTPGNSHPGAPASTGSSNAGSGTPIRTSEPGALAASTTKPAPLDAPWARP
jgi:hypothetical protein